MSYDYQKVQAWLAQVPLSRESLRLWLALVDQRGTLACVDANLRLSVPLLELVKVFCEASTWERTNMLYGLKDIVNQVMAYDVHCYSREARREDAARDPELQRILRERYEAAHTSTQNIPDSSMGCLVKLDGVCRICGQPFDHLPCPHGSIDPATGCNSPVEKADGQGH